jgi:hypothetical protein
VRAWQAGALIVVVGVVFSLPDTLDRIDAGRDNDAAVRAAHASLEDLAVSDCRPLTAPSYRLVPLLALTLDLAPAEVAPGDAAPARGQLVLPASTRAGESLVSASDLEPPLIEAPPGFERVSTQQRDWALLALCE